MFFPVIKKCPQCANLLPKTIFDVDDLSKIFGKDNRQKNKNS